MENADVLVIGGGLLGCFAARNLTKYNLDVILAESGDELCTGISRANTAIIYSGADTKPGTFKTEMCVRACRGFEDLCGELGVRYSKCGSIMLCVGPRGERVLKKKLEQCSVNGVRDASLLTREEVLGLEPNLCRNIAAGLFVPDTGTVMPWELCLAAADNASRNGAKIMLGIKIESVKKVGVQYEAHTATDIIRAKAVINCAGLAADSLHEKLARPIARILPTAGDYFVLDTKAGNAISHIIFHEPEIKGKGLTLVPTIEGNILVGPYELPMDGEDYSTTQEGQDRLRSLVDKVIPNLPMEMVIRSFGAVRPNPHWVETGENGEYVLSERSVDDFVIMEDPEFPGFFSLIGIKTPGLTCSDELGRYLAAKTACLLGAGENKAFNPIRQAPVRVRGLPLDKRERLVSDKPAYGNIVCRCREISEGEILDAIRDFPRAVTLAGVKRKTGAGSGRCQSSFCASRITQILSRELNGTPESYLCLGDADE